jgi:hypothetical protein
MMSVLREVIGGTLNQRVQLRILIGFCCRPATRTGQPDPVSPLSGES